MKKLVTRASACTGCRMCEAVCSMFHFAESNPARSRVVVREDGLLGIFSTVVCRQCEEPTCVEACPARAIRLHPLLGNPVINLEACTACLACIQACPHGAIFTDAATGAPLICDLCGGDPACARFCRRYPHKPHATLEWAESPAAGDAEP